MSLKSALLCSLILHVVLFLMPLSPSERSLGSSNLPTYLNIRLVRNAPAPTDLQRKPHHVINYSKATVRSAHLHTANTSISISKESSSLIATYSSATDEDLSIFFPKPTIYYELSEVNYRPQVIDNIDYLSPVLVNLDVSGTAVLVLYINAAGGIDRVEIEKTDLPETARGSVIQEFGKMRFSGATKKNVPVACKMRIEVILRNSPYEIIDLDNSMVPKIW